MTRVLTWILYGLTGLCALLAVTALAAALAGHTHQLLTAAVCGCLTWCGLVSIKEEEQSNTDDNGIHD